MTDQELKELEQLIKEQTRLIQVKLDQVELLQRKSTEHQLVVKEALQLAQQIHEDASKDREELEVLVARFKAAAG